MKKSNKKGFTIVELVIVIAVIAILAAVLVPTFSNVVANAKEKADLEDVKNAYTATVVDELDANKTDSDNTTVQYAVKQTAGIIVEGTNKTMVKVTAGGKVEKTTDSATWKLNDSGKLEKIVNND